MDNTSKNRLSNLIIGIGIIIFSLFFSFCAKSQDLIVTNNNDSIFCRIMDNDASYLYYQKDRNFESTLRISLKDIKGQKKNWVKGELVDPNLLSNSNTPNQSYSNMSLTAGSEIYRAGTNYNAAYVFFIFSYWNNYCNAIYG